MNFLTFTLITAAALTATPAAFGQSTEGASTFSVGGPGGPIGVGNVTSGNRCGALPGDVAIFPATFAVPEDATQISGIDLLGLTHTFIGDVHIVLRDPNGVGYNLMAQPALSGSGCFAAGFSSNLGGDYTIQPDCALPESEVEVEAALLSDNQVLPSGNYASYFGDWIDTSNGVTNKDLSEITPIPGIWQLEVYDSNAGEVGSLDDWRMRGVLGNLGVVAGSAGGPVPLMQSGSSGDRCTVLPTDMNAFPTSSTVIGGAITSVELFGLNHTWSGDLQIVLRNPDGVGYNLCARLSDSSTCGNPGSSSDFGGDYTFVPAGSGSDILADATVNATITAGSYDQFYGSWVDGSMNVFNTDLASIPLVIGNWTLEIYDGTLGDVGDLVSWRLSTTPVPSLIVCNGVANSTGQSASFSTSGSPSIAVNNLLMTVENLPTESFGYFVVGDACFQVVNAGGGEGTLCVGGDIRRGVGNTIVSSGLTGSVSLQADLANIPTTGFGNPSGVAAQPGQRLFIQYWYRDVVNGAVTSNLSGAILVIATP